MNEIAVPEPLSVLQIMQLAVEKGFDAAQLERIAKLQEWYENREAEKAYVVAMNDCQKKIQTVVRDKENKATRSKYAPIETIQVIAKPVYTENGFSLSFGTVETGKEHEYHVYCDVMHRRGHTTRHFLHNVPNDNLGPKGEPNKTPVQGMVSGLSYAQRKLLSMIFNITIANEDQDGNYGPSQLNEAQVKEVEELWNKVAATGIVIEWKAFMRYAADRDDANLFTDIPLRRLELVKSELRRRLKEKKEATK